MIQLLFSLIFSEMALIVIFVFKTPLRKLVIMGLDRVKRGRGPIIVKTVAGTVFVVMMSTIYSVASIYNRWIDENGDITPTDQILLAQYLLQASLMGFSLFLAFMIDRLHHYIRELSIRRKTMEAVKKQNRAFEDGKTGASEEIKTLEGEASALRGKIKQLESELEEKAKEASGAEANAVALKKQSEGFLLEYDPAYLKKTKIFVLNCNHWIVHCHALIAKRFHKGPCLCAVLFTCNSCHDFVNTSDLYRSKAGSRVP